jgi:hypothetical protein
VFERLGGLTGRRIATLSGLGLLAVGGVLRLVRARELAETARLWTRLESPAGWQDDYFRADLVAELPEPAQRYFLHAIRSGTKLARVVTLEMGGSLRLQPNGAWLPMEARELLSLPGGFVWRATARQGLLWFSGVDSYLDGRGQTRFWLCGLIPIVRAGGPDVSRSARGRLAGEAIWNPAALLPQRGVSWAHVDQQSARATLAIDDEPISLSLTVEPDGRLRSVQLERWGDRNEAGHYAPIPFGMDVLEERDFGGYTIPSRIAGGWWYGTDRFFDFFHGVIRRAVFT